MIKHWFISYVYQSDTQPAQFCNEVVQADSPIAWLRSMKDDDRLIGATRTILFYDPITNRADIEWGKAHANASLKPRG